jgi:hypothetical protein
MAGSIPWRLETLSGYCAMWMADYQESGDLPGNSQRARVGARAGPLPGDPTGAVRIWSWSSFGKADCATRRPRHHREAVRQRPGFSARS